MATTQISKALWKVSKTLYKEEEKRRKNAARQQKADRDRRRRAIRETSLVEAVFTVMEEAVDKATGSGSLPTSVRNLYYQVRPLIQRYTSKELRYEYFSQDLLPRYQEEHGRSPTSTMTLAASSTSRIPARPSRSAPVRWKSTGSRPGSSTKSCT